MVARDRLELAGRLGHDLGDVDGEARHGAAGVGAREQQQVGDETTHPPRGAQRGGGGLARLALELHLEQLEVGEHGGQRRPQLVRRVGDELALAGERRLGLAARLVQRPEHALERERELGDLVVGLRMRDRQRWVACARDRARRVGEPRHRRHRAGGGRQAGEQCEHRAAEHAEPEEDADAVRGRLDVGEPARVLHVERPLAQRPRFDPEAVEVLAQRPRRREVRRVARRRDRAAVQRHHANHGVLARRVIVEVRAVLAELDVADLPVVIDDERRPDGLAQIVGRGGDLAVEVRLDAACREDADDRREPEQDHQREEGRAAGEPPADREPPIRGGRSPRRGPYVGAWARHRLPACAADWRRTPRWCS